MALAWHGAAGTQEGKWYVHPMGHCWALPKKMLLPGLLHGLGWSW